MPDRSLRKWSCCCTTNVSLISTFLTLFTLASFSIGTNEIFVLSYASDGVLFSSNQSDLESADIKFNTLTNASEASNLDILVSMQFKDGVPVSVMSDPEKNALYVAVDPTNFTSSSSSSSCLEQESDQTGHQSNSSELVSCSVIYILDGDFDGHIGILPLRQGERITDMALDPQTGTIYAVGEYNYVLYSRDMEEDVLYEDDVVYMISNISIVDNNSSNTSYATNNDTSIPIKDLTSHIERLSLYGETEEGKEGDARAVAIDTTTNTIYAGLVYFEGGKEGLYLVPERIVETLGYDYDSDGVGEGVVYVPLNGTGPERILVDENSGLVYTSHSLDGFITVVNGSTGSGEISEKIILQFPRAISINPKDSLLYAASGDRYWFNVIDTSTNKVISANEQIAFPISSVINPDTMQVYVVDCTYCISSSSYGEGSAIYQLDSDGSIRDSKHYDDIQFDKTYPAINPANGRIFVLGTNTESQTTELYIINMASLFPR